MEHYFDLPVTYKEQDWVFKGRLITFAYTYKFYIVVNGDELIFEKDDEGSYRILSQHSHQTHIGRDLFEAIITSLKNLRDT